MREKMRVAFPRTRRTGTDRGSEAWPAIVVDQAAQVAQVCSCYATLDQIKRPHRRLLSVAAADTSAAGEEGVEEMESSDGLWVERLPGCMATLGGCLQIA